MDKINKGHEHFVKQEYSQVTSAYLILLTLNKKNMPFLLENCQILLKLENHSANGSKN